MLGDEFFISSLLSLILDTNNKIIINSCNWLLGSLEHQDNNKSILIKHDAHLVMMNILHRFNNYSVFKNVLYVLANIACSKISRWKLVNNLNFIIISNKLTQVCNSNVNKNNSKIILGIWEHIALFISKLCLPSYNNNSFNNRLQLRIIYFFLITFNKALQSVVCINKDDNNHHKLHRSQYYEKQQIINNTFCNILICLIHIFDHHKYMVNKLMNDFEVIGNGVFFASIINCLDYTYCNSVRINALYAINQICAEEELNNTDLYVSKLIKYGLLNKIKQIFQSRLTDHDIDTQMKLILLLSNILSCGIKNMKYILNDEILMHIICDSLNSSNKYVCLSAIYCFNNVLEYGEQSAIKLFFEFSNGKYLHALFVFLKKYPENKYKLNMTKPEKIEIMHCFRNIAMCCVDGLLTKDYVINILITNDFISVLIKLQILKAIDNKSVIDISEFDNETKNTKYIEYLLNIIILHMTNPLQIRPRT